MPESPLLSKYDALLANVEDGEPRVDLLNECAWEISRVHTQEALSRAKEAQELAKELGYLKGVAQSFRTMGQCHWLFGDLTQTIINIDRSIDLFREMEDMGGEADSLNLYGAVYSQLGNYDQSMKYCELALELRKKIGDNEGIVKSMNSIGDNMIKRERYDDALKLFEEAIRIEHDNEMFGGIVLYNISEVHYHLGEYEKALEYLEQCTAIGEKYSFPLMAVYSLWLKGKIAIKRDNPNGAIILLKEALHIARDINAKDRIFNILTDLSEVHEMIGDMELALQYYKEFHETREEVLNDETTQKIKTLAHKNEVEALEKKAEFERSRNELLKEAYTEIENQKDEIAQINKEMMDSIMYAKRIQEAILPSDAYLQELVPDSFVLYLPKDVLSGDFYWISSVVNNKDEQLIVAAVADCTGHGVPGALLSIVGNGFLRRCETEPTVNNAGEALDFVNNGLLHTFRLHDRIEQIKDGMDAAFVAIDRKENKVYFAGAKNSLYLVRGGELIEYKGDTHPIGANTEQQQIPFKNNVIHLQAGDRLYMSSDGFPDQFGGPKGKKYMHKRFKRLLASYQDLPMSRQREALLSEFNEWRGDIEQVDDVCIMGLQF